VLYQLSYAPRLEKAIVASASRSLFRVPLGVLFLFLCICLLGVGYAAARAGGGAWVIAVAAVAIALWLGNVGLAMIRRSHR
jgi:CHASE2 domain-containing sensor protein